MAKKKLGVVKEEIKKVECKYINKDPMFVGIDPSYDGFAIIIIDKDGCIIKQSLLKSTTGKEVEERIVELEEGFKFIPNIVRLSSVYIEGPSYSSNGAFYLQMGALHYYLRIFLSKKGIKYKIIPPTTLKKFAAGNGKAKKELMLLNIYKKWNMEFEDNNLADAYALARYALEDYKDGIR